MNDVGNKGERIVRDYFEGIKYDVTPAPNRKFYSYDMECNHQDHSFTIEVKTDVSAYKHAARRGEPDNPRLFIEFYNETIDEPSGIAASLATYYFYLLVNNDQNIVCNVFKKKDLFLYLLDSDTIKHTLHPSFGDHQTTGWLPYLGDLKDKKILKRQFVIGEW